VKGYDSVTVSNPAIRLATPDDAAAVAAIYAPFVLHTAVSFETEPPSTEEMRSRIEKTMTAHPWLIYQVGDEVAGYAHAGTHKMRSAYRWSADVSVYLGPRWRRQGIGSSLYNRLLPCLRLQGFRIACAGVALPNPGSVGLHERFGFEPVGVYKSIGFKLGRWHDVGWWQLALAPMCDDPPTPVAFPELRESLQNSILSEG
jgi:phosphinothricin acetyltransferase